MLRYKLRTLMIVLTLGPIVLWTAWLVYAMIENMLRIGF
jgi:hypothetical protein